MNSGFRTAVICAILLAACRKPVAPVDGPMAAVTIYGSVTGQEEAGVAGIRIVVEARTQGSCANPPMAKDSTVSDVSGRYRITLLKSGSQFTVCVNARGATGSYARDSVQLAPVQMRSQNPDSVRVDFPLRPSA
jgi:hypothetical protein